MSLFLARVKNGQLYVSNNKHLAFHWQSSLGENPHLQVYLAEIPETPRNSPMPSFPSELFTNHPGGSDRSRGRGDEDPNTQNFPAQVTQFPLCGHAQPHAVGPGTASYQPQTVIHGNNMAAGLTYDFSFIEPAARLNDELWALVFIYYMLEHRFWEYGEFTRESSGDPVFEPESVHGANGRLYQGYREGRYFFPNDAVGNTSIF